MFIVCAWVCVGTVGIADTRRREHGMCVGVGNVSSEDSDKVFFAIPIRAIRGISKLFAIARKRLVSRP